ncbi:hypothetical protein BDR07DRAFT_31981 [Suillus spraguei]|nr:hypothetical protein BDR07DRAFT_31981 [Suillus spraguei]
MLHRAFPPILHESSYSSWVEACWYTIYSLFRFSAHEPSKFINLSLSREQMINARSVGEDVQHVNEFVFCWNYLSAVPRTGLRLCRSSIAKVAIPQTSPDFQVLPNPKI